MLVGPLEKILGVLYPKRFLENELESEQNVQIFGPATSNIASIQCMECRTTIWYHMHAIQANLSSLIDCRHGFWVETLVFRLLKDRDDGNGFLGLGGLCIFRVDISDSRDSSRTRHLPNANS